MCTEIKRYYEFSSFSSVWLRLPQGVFQWLTVLSYYLFSFELFVQVKTLIQENTLYSVRLGGKDDDALRWKSLLWRSHLWSVQMPSTIKWCHNLVCSVAFSAGLIENTLKHVSICDWLASLSNRFKKWGVNGNHIRYQSESFRVWCTVYTCTTLAIYEEGNKT